MTPEEHQKLKYHLKEVSKLLYADTPYSQLEDFESIELAVREHLLMFVKMAYVEVNKTIFARTVNVSLLMYILSVIST